MEEKATFKAGNRKYTYAVGRRKSAVAQLRLYGRGSGKFFVNEKPIDEYFQNPLLEQTALEALLMNNMEEAYDGTVVVRGGGKKGQSDALRLAIARALITLHKDLRTPVKAAGLLTRDARVKERKKYGLKGARKAPQWSKR